MPLDRLIFFPDPDLPDRPPGVEERAIATADGLSLDAWWAGAPDAAATLVWSHGNGGNIGGRADVLVALAARGIAVLAYDYRGYGRSEGRPSEPGVYLDAEAAYDSLRARGVPAGRIVAFGESLGGAVAIRLASVRPCAGVAVVSTFTTLRDAGRAHYGPLALLAGERFLADLSSQAEIRRLAAELCDRYPAIHVLVNNAGVVNLRRSTTVDGIETVFAVNHLAYLLLTHLLLARLRASAPARIVNVASDAHRFGRIDLDDLGHARRYRAMRVYGASKLANVLFTHELARRLDGTGVAANCLHPGAVSTPVEALRVTVPSFCATRTRATVQPGSRKVPKTWKPMEVALPWRMTPGRLPTVTLRAVPLCETWKVSVSPVLEPQVSAARLPTKVRSPP